MYIPKIFLTTDKDQIVAFMKQFSFATIITAKDNLPLATHLPFLVSMDGDDIILTGHFARANEHWKHIEQDKILVVFSEPHAYISPTNYDKEQNVPTWNYISIHAYGTGKLITEPGQAARILESTIDNYEISYRQQWDSLPDEYKSKMIKGIVAFEVVIKKLEAKEKLSQNRTATEQQKIISSLSKSDDTNEKLIAEYMHRNMPAGK